MAVPQMKVPMEVHQSVSAMNDGSQGARRAAEEPPSRRRPTLRWPSLPNGDSSPRAKGVASWPRRSAVAKPARSVRCYVAKASVPRSWQHGANGAMPPHAAPTPHKRGRKADPAIAEARRMAELTKDNERLRRKLAQAHSIIDVQKKLCTLLGLPTAEEPEEDKAQLHEWAGIPGERWRRRLLSRGYLCPVAKRR
jgi:hypothetical protein